MSFDQTFGDVISASLAKALEEHGEEKVLAALENDRFERGMRQAIEESGESVAETLKRNAPPMLAETRALRADYAQMIAEYWGEAFDLYDVLWRVAHEAGEDFGRTHASDAADEDDLVFYVLIRLHARACRVAGEILTLLRAGYGQGAHARWRAMHESVVVAEFIRRHGEATAERYLEHEAVESWRAIHEAQEHASALGMDCFSTAEVEEFDAEVAELKGRYGSGFLKPYGWAAADLAECEGLRCREGFRAIEEAVDWTHLRPSYRLASHPTHANAKSILVTPDLAEGARFLLTGPSLVGLARAGCGGCYSLVNATATLLSSRSGESAPFILTAMLRLSSDAQDTFEAVEERIEREGDLHVPDER